MEWLHKLSEAIVYIENHLDSEVVYEEVAIIACCSSTYFQRMFSYIAGITLSEYIRRRRMSQAAFDLQHKDARVIDIALKYGYSSPTAFNRAFQKVHCISPVLAKRQGCVLQAYPPLHFAVQCVGNEAMTYRIEKKEAMSFMGMRIELGVDMEENKLRVPMFWQEVIQNHKLAKLAQMSKDTLIYGITSYHGDGVYYDIAIVGKTALPMSMISYELPATLYVVFTSEGPYKASFHAIFQRFLIQWLPFSGYVYAHLSDIEVYPLYDEKQTSGPFEVWIAIKKEQENAYEVCNRNT